MLGGGIMVVRLFKYDNVMLIIMMEINVQMIGPILL